MAERRVGYFVLLPMVTKHMSEPRYSYCFYAFLQSASESVDYDRKFLLTGKYTFVHNYCKFFIDLIYLFISSLVVHFFQTLPPNFLKFLRHSQVVIFSHIFG